MTDSLKEMTIMAVVFLLEVIFGVVFCIITTIHNRHEEFKLPFAFPVIIIVIGVIGIITTLVHYIVSPSSFGNKPKFNYEVIENNKLLRIEEKNGDVHYLLLPSNDTSMTIVDSVEPNKEDK